MNRSEVNDLEGTREKENMGWEIKIKGTDSVESLAERNVRCGIKIEEKKRVII